MTVHGITFDIGSTIDRPGALQSEACAARGLLDRLGDKWSLFILFNLQDESMRFNALKRRIDGISQRILTLTLRSLERDGYISRTETPGLVAQVNYALTQLGWELVGLTNSVISWAEVHDHIIKDANTRFDSIRNGG